MIKEFFNLIGQEHMGLPKQRTVMPVIAVLLPAKSNVCNDTTKVVKKVMTFYLKVILKEIET